jgi:4-amino-4-deoxy-L-arabinose transferase-like glycosyltransferase
MADGDSRMADAASAHAEARARRLTRQWIAAAMLVGLAARLAFGLLYWVGQPLTRDEREYLSLARSLAAGRGYVYDEHVLQGPVQPFGRAPGYPAFLAMVGGGRTVADHVPTQVKVAQALVGAIGVALIGALAGRVAGQRAARAAAAIAAIYPPLVWVSAYAYSEAVFWPLALGVVWSFDRLSVADGRFGRAVAAGVVAGVGALVRPAMMSFLPLAAIWLFWRRRSEAAALFACGAAIVLVPWVLRNYAHHDRLVLVASEGGITFWTGNHALAAGEGDLAANPELKRAHQALRERYPELTEEQMEPVYYREAFAWIREHPGAWIALELRKLFYLIVPIGPSYTLHSTRYFAASVLSYGVLLAAAIPGAVRLGAARARTPGLWLLALSSVAVALVFFPQERFRIPILDPTLIVCAAGLAVRAREGSR